MLQFEIFWKILSSLVPICIFIDIVWHIYKYKFFRSQSLEIDIWDDELEAIADKYGMTSTMFLRKRPYSTGHRLYVGGEFYKKYDYYSDAALAAETANDRYNKAISIRKRVLYEKRYNASMMIDNMENNKQQKIKLQLEK